MKFIIDINKEKIINFLESKIRYLISVLYIWITTDGEVLGCILGVFHFTISILIFIVLVISHTIYPAVWLQGTVLLSILLIWIQHVFLKVCISIVAEERLTNSQAPFFGIVNDISSVFKIPLNRLIENILLAETIAVASFSLSFIGRLSIIFHDYYRLTY